MHLKKTRLGHFKIFNRIKCMLWLLDRTVHKGYEKKTVITNPIKESLFKTDSDVISCKNNLINLKDNKTGDFNDPLGQPIVSAGNDCRLILKFRDGRTDGRTLCVKIVITTGRDCGRPRESNKSNVLYVGCIKSNIFVVNNKTNGDAAINF